MCWDKTGLQAQIVHLAHKNQKSEKTKAQKSELTAQQNSAIGQLSVAEQW